jgi:hypothetical protein
MDRPKRNPALKYLANLTEKVMHAFQFLLSSGGWAEKIDGVLPSSAEQLAEKMTSTKLIQMYLKAGTEGIKLKLEYQSSSMDTRSGRQGKYVKVGRVELPSSEGSFKDDIKAWAESCWKAAVDDYHDGLGFVCACTIPKMTHEESERKFHEDAMILATKIVRDNGGTANGGHMIDRLLALDFFLKEAKKKIAQLEGQVGQYQI